MDKGQEAKFYLDVLRSKPQCYRAFIEFLNGALVRGALSLDEIGSNAQELKEIKSKCHKAEALKLLESLRRGSLQPNRLLCSIYSEIDEGGLSLADIGTNEEELERFSKASFIQ